MTLQGSCASISSRHKKRRVGEGKVGWGLPIAVRDAGRFPVCRRNRRTSPASPVHQRRVGRTPRMRHQVAGPGVSGSPCVSHLRHGGVQHTTQWSYSQQRHLAPGSSPARARRGSQPVECSLPQSTQPVDSSTRRKAPRLFAIDVLSSPSGGPPTTYRFSLAASSTPLSGARSALVRGIRGGRTWPTTTLPEVLGRRCPDALASLTRASTLQAIARLKGTRGLP